MKNTKQMPRNYSSEMLEVMIWGEQKELSETYKTIPYHQQKKKKNWKQKRRKI